MSKRGRPSGYNEEIGSEIVSRISSGETMRSISRSADMPAWQTIYRWMAENMDFRDRIAHARELGHEAIAQEALEIADNEDNDLIQGQFGMVPNAAALARAKLRIETRLKLLAKWSPKKYGDKPEGEPGQYGNQQTVNVVRWSSAIEATDAALLKSRDDAPLLLAPLVASPVTVAADAPAQEAVAVEVDDDMSADNEAPGMMQPLPYKDAIFQAALGEPRGIATFDDNYSREQPGHSEHKEQ